MGDKYLFLDVDGVLNHAGCSDWVHVTEGNDALIHFAEMKKDEGDGSYILEGLMGMSKDAVERLNKICAAVPDLQVVLSSTWRKAIGVPETERNLRRQGYTGPRIMAKTPWLGTPRGTEIQAWMDTRRVKPEDIIILDDDSDMVHLAPRLLRTNSDKGLTDAHVAKAIEMLR